MCLGVQGQRQADASVRHHASHFGAAPAEPEREQAFDADRRRQLEADLDREGWGVLRRAQEPSSSQTSRSLPFALTRNLPEWW